MMTRTQRRALGRLRRIGAPVFVTDEGAVGLWPEEDRDAAGEEHDGTTAAVSATLQDLGLRPVWVGPARLEVVDA